MSKANFYRIPVKTKTVHPPRRQQRPQLDDRDDPGRHTGHAPDARPAYHPAPQFRRNRRFWLRRLGLDKEPR